MITKLQILGAEIRAAEEQYVIKHRVAHKGGWIVPCREEVHEYLSEIFGIPAERIKFFFTYSRQCNHPWSEGACEECPKHDSFSLE